MKSNRKTLFFHQIMLRPFSLMWFIIGNIILQIIMKTKLFMLIILATTCIYGCKKFDDSHLWDSINNLNDRVDRLEEMCDRMNANISSLQVIVQALENNDAISNVSSLPNGEGYTITFVSGKVINIYNGTDGKDGSDGQDGSDGEDGITPVISVKQDTDGVYYWTLNGDWLIVDGQKVKAVGKDGSDGQDGTDGEDGAPGSDGTDGKDGITPQFKIEDGYWYISYDNKQTWELVGKATGEDGIDGETFFKEVSIEDGYVCFILNDAESTVIKLPFKAGISLTIQLEIAGTLENYITDEQEEDITFLKLTGEMNEDDMIYINLRLTALNELDLSEANYTATIHNADFCVNPWKELLPNRTIQRLKTPVNINGRQSYDIDIEYCFALKTLNVTSIQRLGSIISANYIVRLPGNEVQYIPYQIDSLILPWGMTKAPSYLNSAANIIFPETITDVNLGAYRSEKIKIKTITCKAIVPPSTGTSSMGCVSSDAILYVPLQSVDLYKAAEDWKTIKMILPIE